MDPIQKSFPLGLFVPRSLQILGLFLDFLLKGFLTTRAIAKFLTARRFGRCREDFSWPGKAAPFCRIDGVVADPSILLRELGGILRLRFGTLLLKILGGLLPFSSVFALVHSREKINHGSEQDHGGYC